MTPEPAAAFYYQRHLAYRARRIGGGARRNEFAQISTDNGATWVNVTVAQTALTGVTLTDARSPTAPPLAGAGGRSGGQRWRNRQPVGQIDTVNPAQVLTIASISTDRGVRQLTLSPAIPRSR